MSETCSLRPSYATGETALLAPKSSFAKFNPTQKSSLGPLLESLRAALIRHASITWGERVHVDATREPSNNRLACYPRHGLRERVSPSAPHTSANQQPPLLLHPSLHRALPGAAAKWHGREREGHGRAPASEDNPEPGLGLLAGHGRSYGPIYSSRP